MILQRRSLERSLTGSLVDDRYHKKASQIANAIAPSPPYMPAVLYQPTCCKPGDGIRTTITVPPNSSFSLPRHNFQSLQPFHCGENTVVMHFSSAAAALALISIATASTQSSLLQSGDYFLLAKSAANALTKKPNSTLNPVSNYRISRCCPIQKRTV